MHQAKPLSADRVHGGDNASYPHPGLAQRLRHLLSSGQTGSQHLVTRGRHTLASTHSWHQPAQMGQVPAGAWTHSVDRLDRDRACRSRPARVDSGASTPRVALDLPQGSAAQNPERQLLHFSQGTQTVQTSPRLCAMRRMNRSSAKSLLDGAVGVGRETALVHSAALSACAAGQLSLEKLETLQ